ncbi:MAG: hypothetical protein AMJ54_14520 [Deltaproteobacteria bacterium SG8_13]|nr:MAG: hypothetical protein AMJ54_14520 [Deltaproteobacteria bacterium SG8_13]
MIQDQWYRHLVAARQQIEPVDSLEAALGGLAIEEAYSVQDRMIADRLKEGERVIGWKVGATSQSIMEQLGINEPVYGCMTSSSLYSTAAPVKASAFCRLAVEGEIAFVTNKRLRGPGITPADVLTATAGIMGAIELVDCRIKGWKPTIAEAVADNSMHAGLILGAALLPASGLNLQTEGVILKQNGRLLASACGIEALGGPLNVVTWLANKLADFDHEIREGEIILTGSLTQYFFVSPGDFVEVSFSHLGDIDFTVT